MGSMETAAAESVMKPGSKTATPAVSAIQASAKTSPLRLLTSGTPTNWNMLVFRTLNREMGQLNANEDNLAPLLRDKLMPLRMWWLKRMPGAMKAFKRGLEHPKHGVPGVLNFVDARTSWVDRVVQDAISSHNISQVVVVAAGFDTRAYRIGAKFKGVKFFEVDLPHASEKKQQLVHELLQPEATFPRPTYLAADLASYSLDSVLMGRHTPSGSSGSNGGHAGSNGGSSSRFDPSQPTLFTVEGLIYYLPEEAVKGLFAAMLKVAAPGSRVAFDFLHKEVLEGSVPCPPAYKVTAVSVANKGEPFISGIPNSREAVQAFLDSVQPTTPTTINTTTGTTTGSTSLAPDAATAAGVASAAGRADGTGAGIGNEAGLGWRVTDFMSPEDAVGRQLPHVKWDDAVPPILSFYSYASAEVVVSQQ